MDRCQLIADAQHILEYPSVFDDSDQMYPFGKSNYECLVAFCELCEQAGLRVHLDESKKFAFADTTGTIEYGVLGHLDVVDTGERKHWNFDPFGAVIADNKLYGRGAQDMKVPMVIILHVLKDLIAEGHTFNKGIRFIIGSDEECGFECMHEYARKFSFPPSGFTPDGEFGIGNIETSLIEYDVYDDEIVDFEVWGGVGYNTVPDVAYYRGARIEEVCRLLAHLDVEYTVEKDILQVFGKAVHVCEIECGKNAIQYLAYALVAAGIRCRMLDYITNGFALTTNSEPINGEVSDKFCGPLATNIGIIQIEKGKQRTAIDMRIPILTDQQLLLQLHESYAKQYGLEFSVFFNDRKIYVDPQLKFMKTLKSIYETITNYPCQFLASRGGSYAKVAPNYVSFGALISDYGEISTVHRIDEYYDLQYLDITYQIYYQTLKNLSV